MKTLQQFIDELQKIEDKSLPVYTNTGYNSPFFPPNINVEELTIFPNIKFKAVTITIE